ncbi:hypothetical protein GOP47_0011761 [Adiantum capillus-veneris]|uniref:Ycf20-like protein n=1 Tax=Adiantum capillus-veneris TaxID=13818 RepID=A0A9D4ZFP7_ADICA|nr:hypothetical protein GOP47_0011761 [Adiantum capillus-veneris]
MPTFINNKRVPFFRGQWHPAACVSLPKRAFTSIAFPQDSYKPPHKSKRCCISSSFYFRSVCYARSQVMDEGSSEDGFAKKSRAEKVEGGTRLSRLLVSSWNSFLNKLVDARKQVPLKLFSLLLGYYSANALSTLVGQTGDWDVIVVGITVALMEVISFLAYRLPAMLSKFEDFLSMLNFWKIGLSLGFILDKFKLDSGMFNF